MKHGTVSIEIEMTNSFGNKRSRFTTRRGVRGSEKPDEMVIIGGHLDSWDLGTGSTDNGTGSMAVPRSGASFVEVETKPKRTIDFVLFSGESRALGSQEYVKAHQNELEKFQRCLFMTPGTGRVLAIGMHDNYQDRELAIRF